MDTKEKLYRVQVEYTLFIVAENKMMAEGEAHYYIREDGSEPDIVIAREIKEFREIDYEWRNSIPFGSDKKDERTCSQRLIN